MVAKDSSLTTSEKRRLEQHEATIEQGLRSFVDVGHALLSIRTDRLYTDVDETFEGYCKKRWGFAKSRAYQLIDAAKVVDVISTMVETPAPDNERQARILASVPTEQQQATVWAKVVETAPKDADGAPKITAAFVQRVADEIAPKPPKADAPQKPVPEPSPADDGDDGGFEDHEALKPLGKLDATLTKMMNHYAEAEKILGKSDALLVQVHAGLDATYKALVKLRAKLRRAK